MPERWLPSSTRSGRAEAAAKFPSLQSTMATMIGENGANSVAKGRLVFGSRAEASASSRGAMELVGRNAWLVNYPLINTARDIDAVTTIALRAAFEGQDCYCWTSHFHHRFVAELMCAGFLPMSHDVHGYDNEPGYILFPKLHSKRCVLDFKDLRVDRGAKKRSKNYTITMDTAFERVIEGCSKQHALRSWLYPPLVNAFRNIHEKPEKFDDVVVRVHTFEVWTLSGELVAGELGYSVGGAYTSLTGFTGESGAGTVQMIATARHLQQAGFHYWDLGMEIRYKMELGAHLEPRTRFLERLTEARRCAHLQMSLPKTKCSELVLPSRKGCAGRDAESTPKPVSEPKTKKAKQKVYKIASKAGRKTNGRVSEADETTSMLTER